MGKTIYGRKYEMRTAVSVIYLRPQLQAADIGCFLQAMPYKTGYAC